MVGGRRPALVIFDCDGVLVDSERLELDTIAESLGWLDVPPDAVTVHAADLHRRHLGGKLSNLVAMIESDLGRAAPEGFLERYRAAQLQRLEAVTAIPGAVDVVESLAELGVPRCVVSGGPQEKMRVTLRATGLWSSLAPHIYSCYDIGDHKPSPGIYLHALAQFGVDAADAVAIEDSENGMRAAVGAGVPAIGLARDVPAERLSGVGASTVIEHMSEAPAAIARLAAGAG